MSQQQQQHRGGDRGRGRGRGSSGGTPRGGGFGSGNMRGGLGGENMRGGLGGENGRGGGASASASVSSTPVDPEQVRKWLIAIREVPTMVISGLLPAAQAGFDEALRQFRLEQHLLTVKQTSTTPQTQPTQGGQLHQQGQNRSQQSTAMQAQNAGPSRTTGDVTAVFQQLPPGGRGPKPALRSAKMTVEELGLHGSGKIWIRVTPTKGTGYWRPKEWEPMRKMGAYRFETMSRAPPVGVFPDCTMDWWRQDRNDRNGDVFDKFDLPNKGMAMPRTDANPLTYTAAPSHLKPVWILEHFHRGSLSEVSTGGRKGRKAGRLSLQPRGQLPSPPLPPRKAAVTPRPSTNVSTAGRSAAGRSAGEVDALGSALGGVSLGENAVCTVNKHRIILY
ncbi:hypothetical protein LTS10_009077 [Elasticomyces elasticus]|nr:hypothetical protein LTS10_009077 [Elasticomyces elasticus]